MTHILSQGPGRYRLCQAPGWQNADERWGAAVARSDKFSHHESTTLVRSFFVRICCCTFDTAASRMRPTNHVLNSINNPRPLPPINRGISSANYHSRPFPFSSSLLLCLLTTHVQAPLPPPLQIMNTAVVGTPTPYLCSDLTTPLGLQSRFGDKLLRIGLVCPHHGAAVLKALLVAVGTSNGKKDY